ncbi:hypothetical protein ABMA27_007692 [Loxostege sticticalis]|uniref:Ig-like domain-containing protein n=1 Tax=Loxostege sticticalis TaxID=481309 RepID=A0ABR3HGC3_LOXSC
MGPVLFAIVATALIGRVSCGWRDVAIPRSLAVTGNHTGTLRDGDVVEIVCNASGILPYSTLRWTSQQENIQQNTWFRGRSPLSLVLRVTPELHGIKYFCSAPFTEINEETDRFAPYTVNSELLELSVEGGWPQRPFRPGHIEMASEAGDTHHVGDIVTFTCSTYDIPFTVVDVLQAKGMCFTHNILLYIYLVVASVG